MAMVNNIYIKKSGLELELCSPSFESGYYRGTRFDHSGIFRRIIFKDFIIADEWFDKYNPYAHDAVCGASEEFTQSGYEETEVGGSFLKPGVGLLLKENNSDYDRFMLYKVVDSGKWNFKNDEDMGKLKELNKTDTGTRDYTSPEYASRIISQTF